MENVAIYARVSQDRSGLKAGVERQIADSRELAAQRGMNVVSVEVDNDVSATSGQTREAWDKVIALVKSGEINGVVVWHTDRLYRKVRDLATLLDLAEKYQLKIHAVTAGEIDLSNPTGRMLATMIAGAASFEVEQKAARSTRKNLDTALKGGYHGGPVPMGYKRGSRPGELELDDHQAELMREAADRLIGGETLNGTTRWMRDALNRPALKPNSLKDALTRPTTAGFRRHVSMVERRDWNRRRAVGEVSGELPENVNLYPAQWKPVLEYDKWLAVRHVLLSAVRKRGRPAEKSLLSGVLICEICYTKLGYSAQSYKCPGKDRNGCAGVAISTSRIEELVSGFIRVGHMSRKAAEPLPVVETERFEHQAMSNTRKQFLELFRRRRITEFELNQQLDLLDAEMQKLDLQEVEEHRRRVSAERARTIDRTTWDEADDAQKRDIVSSVFPEGITILKSVAGRSSGASFKPGRVYLGPPPWLNERLPEPMRQMHAEARIQRLAGVEPSWPVSPLLDMSPDERADHDAEFRRWQNEMDSLTD